MENEQAQAEQRAQAPAVTSTYPAISVSKPPPPRERAMTYIVSGLFAAAFLLAVAGFIQHWLQAP